MTVNVCAPVPSPLSSSGVVQDEALTPSSEQVTLVGPFVVVQAKVAPVAVVDASGTEVSVSVGFATDAAELEAGLGWGCGWD